MTKKKPAFVPDYKFRRQERELRAREASWRLEVAAWERLRNAPWRSLSVAPNVREKSDG